MKSYSYQVVRTEQADADITAITDYIAYKFKAPLTALKKAHLIQDAINHLHEHPFWQHQFYDNPWQGLNLYLYHVDRYTIVHLPDADAQTTTVLRILHDLQDLSVQLSRTGVKP